MKLLPIILSFPLVSLLGEAVKADIWVDGYQRKDGTHVRGHWKTKPNNSLLDNYSHQGNYNPYKKIILLKYLHAGTEVLLFPVYADNKKIIFLLNKHI